MSKVTDLSPVKHFYSVLAYVKAERAKLNEIEAEAKEQIQEALGDKEIGVLDGKQVVSWSRHQRTALSARKVKELFPAVAEQCTETTEIRTFRLLED